MCNNSRRPRLHPEARIDVEGRWQKGRGKFVRATVTSGLNTMRFIDEMRPGPLSRPGRVSRSLSWTRRRQDRGRARRGLISREKTFHSTSVPERFIFKETVGLFLRHVTRPSSERSPFSNAVLPFPSPVFLRGITTDSVYGYIFANLRPFHVDVCPAI